MHNIFLIIVSLLFMFITEADMDFVEKNWQLFDGEL